MESAHYSLPFNTVSDAPQDRDALFNPLQRLNLPPLWTVAGQSLGFRECRRYLECLAASPTDFQPILRFVCLPSPSLLEALDAANC